MKYAKHYSESDELTQAIAAIGDLELQLDGRGVFEEILSQEFPDYPTVRYWVIYYIFMSEKSQRLCTFMSTLLQMNINFPLSVRNTIDILPFEIGVECRKSFGITKNVFNFTRGDLFYQNFP